MRWNGFVKAIGSYQRKVLGKGELPAVFTCKVSIASIGSSNHARQDWSGMDAILRSVFCAFSDKA